MKQKEYGEKMWKNNKSFNVDKWFGVKRLLFIYLT